MYVESVILLLSTFLVTAHLDEAYLDIREAVQKLSLLEELQDRLQIAENRLAANDPNFSTVQHVNPAAIEHHLKKDVRIAFTAALTQTVPGLSPGSVIVFDEVSTNLGNGYSNSTGIFTCPVDGNYFIMTSLMSGRNNMIHTETVLDGVPKAAVYAQSDASSLNMQGSNSVVTHCLTGQRIWVRVKEGTSLYGDMTSPLTQFTGYLIWED